MVPRYWKCVWHIFRKSTNGQRYWKCVWHIFRKSKNGQISGVCFFYNCAMQLLELSLACHVQKIRSNQLNIFFLSRPECRVLSMSLYPDLIHTLSRFYPAFIQIFFINSLYPNFIQILSLIFEKNLGKIWIKLEKKTSSKSYPDFLETHLILIFSE